MSENKEGGAFLVLILALLPLMMLRAFVLKTLWNWHALTVFVGLSSMTTSQALSAIVIIDLIKVAPSSKSEINTTEEAIFAVVKAAIFALVALTFGWIVHAMQSSF